jgi:hypothetical protein
METQTYANSTDSKLAAAHGWAFAVGLRQRAACGRGKVNASSKEVRQETSELVQGSAEAEGNDAGTRLKPRQQMPAETTARVKAPD